MTSAVPTLYGIVNCDTVKKARAHLAAQGVAYTFHDFKKQGVPAGELDRWIAAVGWERLVNRQGTTWRKLSDAARNAVVDAASARRLMLDQASVIKRPVADWGGGRITVGLDIAAWDGARQAT
jgi:Spx/MgsR family transcriptional regulator